MREINWGPAKVVRDMVPEQDGQNSQDHPYEYIDGTTEEIVEGLGRKLSEEAGEAARAGIKDKPGELGDLLSTMQAYAEACGISWEDVLKAQKEKDSLRGGFTKGKISIPKK